MSSENVQQLSAAKSVAQNSASRGPKMGTPKTIDFPFKSVEILDLMIWGYPVKQTQILAEL